MLGSNTMTTMLPEWAEGRDPKTLWQCSGCGAVFSNDRRRFRVTTWSSVYDHKRDTWGPENSVLCGYCEENHERWYPEVKDR